MSEERFDRIDQKLTALESRFGDVDRRIDGLDRRLESGLGDVNRRIDDLDHQMHVLHEDVIGRIAAIPDNTARLEARMDRGFADLKETIGRRLDPLEAAVRQHSAEIEQLTRDRLA